MGEISLLWVVGVLGLLGLGPVIQQLLLALQLPSGLVKWLWQVGDLGVLEDLLVLPVLLVLLVLVWVAVVVMGVLLQLLHLLCLQLLLLYL